MNKLGRKVTSLLLAAAVAISVASPAFAATSPDSGKTTKKEAVAGVTNKTKTNVSARVTGKNTVAVTKISKKKNTKAAIPSSITDKATGKKYTVSVIKTGTITKKYKRVSIYMKSATKVEAKIMKSKTARKTKKIIIRKVGKKKLKASQFNKKAFKGYKGKIIVKKSAMTKKQYKKLVKKLRKGGFKGKIYRKK